MLEMVLSAALTKKQREAGLYLEEPDDHLLCLKQEQIIRAVFSQTGATIYEIRKEGDRWISSR